MKKVFKICLAVALGSSMLLTGCSSDKSNPQIDSLQGQISQLQKENEKLLTQIEELQKQVEVLNQNEVEENVAKDEEYPIYAANIDTLEKEVIGSAKVTTSMSLINRLNAMGQTLSEINFEGLPIVVEEIKDIDGKQVAMINLKEDSSKEVGWMSTYFQGSTGAQMTATSIIETFLQQDMSNEEEWIDGIQMLYEGKVTETEHMPELGKVIYK